MGSSDKQLIRYLGQISVNWYIQADKIEGMGGLSLLALTAAHENGRGTDRNCRFQITPGISDAGHAAEIDLKAAGDFMQKTGEGFATKAFDLRGVRAEKDGLHLTTQAGQIPGHPAVDGVEIVDGK